MQTLHLRIRSKLDDGRELEVTPVAFAPLTLGDMERIHADPEAEVELHFEGKDPKIDGAIQASSAKSRLALNFTMPPVPFALVAGGWLPIPFVLPQRFLVDRNVVSILRRIRTQGAKNRDETFVWWTQYFEGGGGIFNPLPYAFEGSMRRTPTKDEFIKSFEEGSHELNIAFPHATVIKFEAIHFDAAYTQLIALQERGARDVQFLLDVVPYLHDRVSRSKDAVTQKFILSAAQKNGVQCGAPVVLAALSSLYEDVHGRTASIGRRLIKPTPEFTQEDAYNAVSDLRHIELAALSSAVLEDGQFALCTADRALAEFWCALEIRGSSSPEPLNIQYRITDALVPRLSPSEVVKLAGILRDS